MRRISRLEQEYRNLKRQAAPDLWSRIEERLEEHPERSVIRGEQRLEEEYPERGLNLKQRHRGEKGNRKAAGLYKGKGIFRPRVVFGAAASAAAIFLFMAAGSWYDDPRSLVRNEKIFGEGSEMLGGEAGADWETTAFVQETYLAAEEIDGENHQIKGETAPQETACPGPDPSAYAGGNPPAGEGKKAEGAPGVLLYSQLELADYQSLSLPAQAVTVSEDAMYFSEEILEDTELLCVGTVASVSLEPDDSGCPAFLVYEIPVDSVCYSETYTTGLAYVQVKSPIVRAVGGHNQILYQMQVGASYVLSLKSADDGWELLFPYAPQIQVTPGGGYLFHSGYGSLADDSAFVVVGQQEGDNDFYYDRMLLREDGDFLSDLISLVMNQSSNGGKG
ncbi:MAG: hypothetical protein HFG78_07570 [Hungatella sp.]|nr:hypothetical protein [Hungatella sp.]